MFVIASSLILWLGSTLSVRRAEVLPGELGIITILPTGVIVAISVVIAGFVYVLLKGDDDRLLGGYVVALTVMLQGLAGVVYGELTTAWAWKHVAVVEFLQRAGTVDPYASSLAAYQNWPGFFSANAWAAEASGLQNPLQYAPYAPIAFNLAFILCLVVLYRAFTNDPRLIWGSVMLFQLSNWVGQDYFSPQAMAFMMYLMVLAILIRWFRSDGVSEAAEADGPGIRAVTAPIVVMLLLAIAMSHQITPIMTSVAIVALTLFGGLRVRWPAVVAVGTTVLWMVGPALPFTSNELGNLLGDLGAFQSNVEGSVVNVAELAPAAQTVARVSRLLSAVVVGLAAIGVLRRWRAGLQSRWLVTLAAAPAAALAMSSYGGEVIFRVYLFALPFLAFLAASTFFSVRVSRTSRVATLAFAALIPVLSLALIIAANGGDERSVFTQTEVDAAGFVTASGRDAFVVEVSRDYPGLFESYERFELLTLDRLPAPALERVVNDPASTLAKWIRESDDGVGFIIVTDSQERSISRLGTLQGGVVDKVLEALFLSAEFEVAFLASDAIVFEYTGVAS